MTTPAELQDTREPSPLRFQPGFFSESSDTAGVQRWKDGNRVRFKNGLPQKLGGWIVLAGLETEVEDDENPGQFIGTLGRQGLVRRYHEWTSLDGQKWIAEGTHRKLYLLNNGERYDITPIRRIQLLGNDPFSMVDLDFTVTVTDVGHGAQTGDFVRFSGATAAGGITINGEYDITVINGDTYTIEHTVAATSTTTGGGAAVTAEYDISGGSASNQRARGWGTCAWGEGTWGTPRDPNCSNIVSGLRLWSLGNFGEDLIASPRGGAVYRWDRTLGPTSRAVVLPEAPPINQRVLISQTGGRIVCLGAFDFLSNTPDPMFIVAGEEEGLDLFREPQPGEEENDVYVERAAKGSRLITGVTTRVAIIVFSDTAVYTMLPDSNEIFDLQVVGEGNSVCGPNAAIEINGTVYFMGQKKFLKFDGVVTEMPCDVWGNVFDNEDDTPGFNEAQADKVYAWHNEDFNEIWWQYPSSEVEENDRAVIYNYAENLWFYVALDRTAALPKGPTYGTPIAANADSTFQHETGTDDDVLPMNEYIESYDAQIGDGKGVMHVSNFIPDLKRHVGTLQLTLKTKNRPAQVSYIAKGPYEFDPGETDIGVRAAGRQMAVRIGSAELGTDWRLGNPSLYGQADGEGR